MFTNITHKNESKCIETPTPVSVDQILPGTTPIIPVGQLRVNIDNWEPISMDD